MSSPRDEIHVMFLPYMASGHMMPLVDIARIFAANGVKVTIITTTANALPFKNAIHRDARLGRDISFEILRFPCKEAGLPEGCQNLSSAENPEISIKLFHAIEMLQPDMELLFWKHRPHCIVSDYLFPWTVGIADELGIPRLAFSGSGFFNLCVANSIDTHKPHVTFTSETEEFVVPHLPDRVTLTRSQLPDIVKTKNEFSALFERLKEAGRKSYGVLMNSFYELEPAYADHFTKVTGIKAWHLGPASLFNKGADDKIERGERASICGNSCLSWLDAKKPSSVLYICFGSLTRFSKAQVLEIASALEDSGHSFIWVLGKVIKYNDDNEKSKDEEQEWWLPEGYEERLKRNRQGLVVKGWAPQVLILEHPAIGGFLTHCGWNSILEGVCGGVPMVTWPIFAEQFYNEKLITQVLRFGVAVGNEVWKVWATEGGFLTHCGWNSILEGVCGGVPMVTWPIFAEQFYNEKLITQVLRFGVAVGNEVWKVWATEESPVVIGRDKIERAVKRVMDNTEEAREMRKRAIQLGEMAKRAVENGGSSHSNMEALIQEIKTYKRAS